MEAPDSNPPSLTRIKRWLIFPKIGRRQGKPNETKQEDKTSTHRYQPSKKEEQKVRMVTLGEKKHLRIHQLSYWYREETVSSSYTCN